MRFDQVYHLNFKCNRKRLIDYPNLWDHARALFEVPGIAETISFAHIMRHNHDSINPNRIIPINPVLDFYAPHERS